MWRWLTLLLMMLIPWTTVRAQQFVTPDPTLVPTEDPYLPADMPEDWIRTKGVAFTIFGDPTDLAEQQRLLDHASASWPELSEELGVPLGGRVHVFLTESEAQFHDLQPGRAPTWADATAWPNQRAIFLRTDDARPGVARPLTQVLDHELVHVLLGQAFGPRPVPSWLQEGLAQVHAGEVGADHALTVGRDLWMRQRLSLEQLTGPFPASAADAQLAYTLSADVILWIQDTYGDDAMRDIIRKMAHGATPEVALHEVTDLSMAELEEAWRLRYELADGWRWALPENLDTLLFGLASLGLVFLGLRRRRVMRHELANWDDQERALDKLSRQLLRRWYNRRS